MSNKTIRTELRGYPIHYDELTGILNDAMNNLRKANFDIKNAKSYNSVESDFCPTFYNDGIVFCSNRKSL